MSSIRITPDIDRREITLDLELNRHAVGTKIHIEVRYHNQLVCHKMLMPQAKRVLEPMSIEALDYVDELHYWTPERPELFDLYITVENSSGTYDFVQTYFGMRKIDARNGQIYLNNKPYYLRLVLDQGYWQDSLMTPPGNASLKEDILLTKAFGFNGARKHQKIEDERYYYWADQLGLLVWAEMPSSYAFCAHEVTSFMGEWVLVVTQLYNYPSIMTWVPFNESWGIRNVLFDSMQQNFAESAYHITKALDSTRLVSTNDGWEQVTSDLCGIHDYYDNAASFQKKYHDMDGLLQKDAQGRKISMRQDTLFVASPLFFLNMEVLPAANLKTVLGDIIKRLTAELNCWERIRNITVPIQENKRIAGYCYTQLTDVMQEINGWADANHRPKFDAAQAREIFEQTIE